MKSFIPPLVAAYLDSLQTASQPPGKQGSVPLAHGVCQILDLFCKVRGEKVVKGFLNNEPRYLESVLLEFEEGRNYAEVDDGLRPRWIVPWAERYILLLWLSHLMLAPFPLASISTTQSSHETATALGIDLPPELPGVALRTLAICFKGIQSATKERGAAANLLVRLCVRPDMQKLNLLQTSVDWSVSFFSTITEHSSDIHHCLGVLSFLSGLVTSATNEEIGPFLPAIDQTCKNIIGQEHLGFIKASAVARKLVIKSFRNIILHCLQEGQNSGGLDATTVLEEIIEYLLETLGDGDTPVRYAASKALSIVTQKLDSEMSEEVVEAILGSLNENVYWQGSVRNTSGVGPLRWHGLTLTLSHLLYRRAISTTQLPDILNALLLALTFEQRSATGGSIGTNVRDAACFGIWALSRRYLTKDLLAVETTSVRAAEYQQHMSILQVLAVELLVVACLDPAGNIRRGSSAALQELIGRNPNTVEEGIPLVQVVDYHAAGLRERAMCDVAIKAGALSPIYWEALFENMLGWRGTGSLDSSSRLFAARAIGLLSSTQDGIRVHQMSERIWAELSKLKAREVEERQGLVSALTALMDQCIATKRNANLAHLWNLLQSDLRLEEKSFTSPALRPELTASSICDFLGAMSTMACQEHHDDQVPEESVLEAIRLFTLCLTRQEDAVLQVIPRAACGVVQLLRFLDPKKSRELVAGWVDRLENEASYNGLRCSGYAVALGAVYSLLGDDESSPIQKAIVDTLRFRCSRGVAIEARRVAFQAFNILLQSYSVVSTPTLDTETRDKIALALCTGLNDYTVTDRGDVGSLVRLEALTTTGTAWRTGLLKGSPHEEEIHAHVLRLSLEKLDKIRSRAAQVLDMGEFEHLATVAKGTMEGVSSYAYFANTLTVLHLSTPQAIKDAICFGYMSAAGMGSESVMQNARAALLDAAEGWPDDGGRVEDEKFTLLDFASTLLGHLGRSLGEERVLPSILEVVAFLFDMQVLQRLISTTFK